MSEQPLSPEDCRATIEKLIKICRQLQEENERLKERIRTFYGN